MTFESHRNRISILKSGRRALESRSATTFATRWHREKGRIAAFEFFFFGCLELREFKYFESPTIKEQALGSAGTFATEFCC